MSSLWVAESSEIAMFNSGYIQVESVCYATRKDKGQMQKVYKDEGKGEQRYSTVRRTNGHREIHSWTEKIDMKVRVSDVRPEALAF